MLRELNEARCTTVYPRMSNVTPRHETQRHAVQRIAKRRNKTNASLATSAPPENPQDQGMALQPSILYFYKVSSQKCADCLRDITTKRQRRRHRIIENPDPRKRGGGTNAPTAGKKHGRGNSIYTAPAQRRQRYGSQPHKIRTYLVVSRLSSLFVPLNSTTLASPLPSEKEAAAAAAAVAEACSPSRDSIPAWAATASRAE